ncbi:MAG: hypothetical protein P4L53_22855 [Candidatus Obscuribacterales bacterium]|nr:hypothetical protein [Candidatus Obscuribacterales bacterium]
MNNYTWIEIPSNARRHKISPEVEALRDAFLSAQKIGFHLLCASNQLLRSESPDVTACAAIVREAVHKPEKDRTNAIKAAEEAVLQRQVNYVSALADYQQHRDAWQIIRPTLVAHLEAVLTPPQTTGSRETSHYVDIDLSLNCEAVANLIDDADIAINEVNKRRFNQPTEKHAQAGFQKVFDRLAAEVAGPHWVGNARCSVDSINGADILRDIPVEKIASTDVPSEFAKCCALDAARAAFERVFNYDLTSRCRDFRQDTRGTVNDTQMSEALLSAMPDVSSMIRIEQQRDSRLRTYGRSWRSTRSMVDASNVLFVDVAELLPEAIVEAAAIVDDTMRRRAQNLCLFAARRLKENLKFVRECNRYVAERDSNRQDITSAIGRSHQALVERVKSKQMQRPTTACREEPYYG